MDLFTTTLILILVVSLSGVIKRVLPVNFPLPLIQIALGSALAYFHIEMELEPEVFLVLFIPPLLFADGRKTKVTEFLHNSREIIGLALVLVLVTVVGAGYLLHYLIPNIALPVAFALAAVLSPTDAVALSGIVGQGQIIKAKMEILEGESLMNDASGLVSFKFAILVATGAMQFDLINASISFLLVAIGGLAIGVLVTWLYLKILRFIVTLTHDDVATQIVSLFLLPFAAYITAEHLGTSGILAAVSAGMAVNRSGLIRNLPLTTRLQSDSSWSMLTFIFNGLVFVILGLQLPFILNDTIFEVGRDDSIELWQLFTIVVIIYTVLILMRFFWLFIMKKISLRLLKRKPLAFSDYSTRDLWVSTFAGVRGAITLAGVLSVPISISGRYELVFIAAGVILLSLICSVLALQVLLKDGNYSNKTTLNKEEEYARKAMAQEAIITLEKMQERLHNDPDEPYDDELINEAGARVISYFRHRIDHSIEEENLERRMRLIAIGAGRATLYQLRAKNEIGDETLEHLMYELDVQETILADDN